MKKIGITTFYNAINYGAFLQCFALQELLRRSYDVCVLDYKNSTITSHYKIIKTRSIKSFVRSVILSYKNYCKKRNFNKCIKNNIYLGKINDRYDVVIAGSDQIWNINLTGGVDSVFTLKKFNKVKKISYASSIGEENLVISNPDIYRDIIDNINYVSVREDAAKKELEKVSSRTVKVNLDPTLTLSSDFWDKHLTNNKISEKYIFSYFVGATSENYEALNKFSDMLGLKVLSYSENPKEKNILRKCYTDDPFEFITKIKNSDYVFTSSFHGTVFAILFNKQFICMLPKKKSNRITNLLNQLNLSDRAIKSIDDLEKFDFKKKIDYEYVNKKLEELRKDSIDWLVNSIEE